LQHLIGLAARASLLPGNAECLTSSTSAQPAKPIGRRSLMTSGSDPTHPSLSSPEGREILVDRLVAGYADSLPARGVVAMAVGMLGSIFGPVAGVAAAGDAALSAWASHIQSRR